MIYYIYHIPGKKIGSNNQLEKAELKINRVMEPGEYDVIIENGYRR